MKHDYAQLRDKIQNVLKSKGKGLEASLKVGEFLQLLDEIDQGKFHSREELIKELAEVGSPIYSHGVFGRFEVSGHYLQQSRGPCSKIRQYADGEREYAVLFDREGSCNEFKARIWAQEIEEGAKFKLIFNDRQGDARGGSHTDYTLIVSNSQSARIKEAIKSDPTLLIEVFQKVFPKYDRSNGKLKLHEENSYSEH